MGVVIGIRDQEPPIANRQLCKVGYLSFKEHAQLALRYRT